MSFQCFKSIRNVKLWLKIRLAFTSTTSMRSHFKENCLYSLCLSLWNYINKSQSSATWAEFIFIQWELIVSTLSVIKRKLNPGTQPDVTIPETWMFSAIYMTGIDFCVSSTLELDLLIRFWFTEYGKSVIMSILFIR